MQRLTAKKVRHLGQWIEVPPACPLQDDRVSDAFARLVRDTGDFSLAFQEHLQNMPRQEAASWLGTAVENARPLLRPWVMELLFLIGARGDARFGELERGLGISSKVLASRLKDLVAQGLVVRTVHDETPVLVTYSLSKTGRATAALATPLFTHLNML